MNGRRILYIYLISYFVLWVIFFEFILPANRILPKPSIVAQSFPSLVTDYNFPANYLSTVIIIYIALLAGYLSVKLVSRVLNGQSSYFRNFIYSLDWFSKYIPGIILGLFLLFWFPASEYIEFIFAYFIVFIPLLTKYLSTNIPEEYILASRSLLLSPSDIKTKLEWKFAQADLMSHLSTIHFNLWLVLIAFEFIKGGYGIGNIFQRSLQFSDLSVFFSTAVVTGLTIYAGSASLKYIYNKVIFWK